MLTRIMFFAPVLVCSLSAASEVSFQMKTIGRLGAITGHVQANDLVVLKLDELALQRSRTSNQFMVAKNVKLFNIYDEITKKDARLLGITELRMVDDSYNNNVLLSTPLVRAKVMLGTFWQTEPTERDDDGYSREESCMETSTSHFKPINFLNGILHVPDKDFAETLFTGFIPRFYGTSHRPGRIIIVDNERSRLEEWAQMPELHGITCLALHVHQTKASESSRPAKIARRNDY